MILSAVLNLGSTAALALGVTRANLMPVPKEGAEQPRGP